MMKRLIFVLLFTTSLFITGFTKCSGSSDLLTYIDSTGLKRPVKTLADWELKRQQILDSLQMVMGKLPDRRDLPALNIQITDSLKEDNYTRFTINFTVAENEIVPAYLYVPVQNGIDSASEVYRFLQAEDKLQVRYPEAGHDFPPEVRLQAYRFIDKILKHNPSHFEIK